MADDSSEKKHEPGDRKWREAAERGELPRSPDVNAAAIVISVSTAMVFLPGSLISAIERMSFQFFHALPPYELTVPAAREILMLTLDQFGRALVVPLGVAVAVSILASLAQTGVQLAPKALEPRWERLDVVNGFQQTYLSPTPLIELAKALAKIFVIALAVILALWPSIRGLPELMAQHPNQLMSVIVQLGMGAVLAATPVMIAVAAIDYAASYNRSYQQLKRTDRELREDQKSQEGDPRLKAMRRQRARKIAMSVSLNAVRDADVVVTNPTHFAVALRYRRGLDEAPVVVCKGADLMAKQIRREGLRHGVPRIENRPLARALYADAEVDAPIPEELYAPVARVLAVVYRRRMVRRRGRK